MIKMLFKKRLLFPIFMIGGITTTQAQKLNSTTQSLSLTFVENKGQVIDQHGNSRDDIQFRIGGKGLNIFIGNSQLHYQWTALNRSSKNERSQLVDMYRMDVTLLNADPNAQVITEQKQGFYEQYYTSQFNEQGTTAYSYQRITYMNVYPNIDWMLYIKDNTVEYDFIVRPGGKVSDIKLQYNGATQLSIDKAARLTSTTPMGSITENTPYSYQQADGKTIASLFTLKDNIVSFSIADYNGTLVIDPTLTWSTYYGDISAEAIRNGCVAGDKYGNSYLCGNTGSTSNIATTGAHLTTLAGSTDAFVVKFSPSGARIWATYYGGASAENSFGTTCDTFGNIYLSGYTESTSGIATISAHQTTLAGSSDAFLVKFDTGGVRLWATYYGGTGTDQCFGVTCDKSNNVFISGNTQSTSGISSVGSHQTSYGGATDAYIAKFNSSGTLLWGSYYGGTLLDFGQGINCDKNKNVYLTGYTRSTSAIATIGAHQATWNTLDDAFLVKFDSTGVRQWATYYGGSALDRGVSLCTDYNNNIYMAGSTASTTAIATVGSHQAAFGGGTPTDAFLVKFNSSGVRQWGTYYGSTAIDDAGWVCGDMSSNIYLFGRTASSSGIATIGTWKDTLDGTSDAMLIKFDTTGVRIWATYFGGDATEIAYGVYCNQQSRVFIGGQTTSSIGLAATGSFQTAYAGLNDGFLAVFNDCLLTAPASISGNDTVCRGTNYTYSIPSVAGATSYTWNLPTGWTGSSTTNSILVTAGITTDTIKVVANFSCGTSVPTVKVVIVSALPTITPAGTSEICSGDSVLLTASTGTSYQWLSGGVIIPGATASGYYATTANTYSVVVNSTSGCADTSLQDTVIVHPLPVPIITATGMVLSTGSFSTYQWSHNGTPIMGATAASYTMVITSGTYEVTVTDSNGCTGTSAPYSPAVGIDEISEANELVSVYPNPIKEWIFINAKVPVTISIYSADGRLILQDSGSEKIDVSNWSDGLYLLRIHNKDGVLLGSKKLVKANNNW